MDEARQRTETLLKHLDEYISGFRENMNGSQALYTIKWMNRELDSEQLHALIKELDLTNADVIEYLLERVELDPKRYN